MTDTHDNEGTRPISVAELLAKNGTIGAPPAGGRRRRRRGNSDAVTVAELTGEIPIIHDDQPAPAERTRRRAPELPTEVVEPAQVAEEPVAEEPVAEEPVAEEPVAEELVEEAAVAEVTEAPAASEPELTDAETEYALHVARRNEDPEPIDFAPPRRTQVRVPTGFAAPAGGAEQMSPDPVVDDDELLDLGPDADFEVDLDEALESERAGTDEQATQAARDVPSYLRSGADTLFGGQSVADDIARRGWQPGPEDVDLRKSDGAAVESTADDVESEAPDADSGSGLIRGAWVVAQCVLAVAFGAGLFIAFDQLWRWNTIVALVLSVLVILGLVVGVRVVRKTEDIGSTLIAVAVGALVTLGPLALLQSH